MKLQIRQLDLKGYDPLQVFLLIPEEAKELVFFASDGTANSRWSILAWNPLRTISYDGASVSIDQNEVSGSFSEHFNALLQERRESYDGELPFIGGAIGSIDYEFGYELLGIPHPNKGKVVFSFYDSALIFDHLNKEWFSVGENDHSCLLEQFNQNAGELGVEDDHFFPRQQFKKKCFNVGENDHSRLQGLRLEPSWDIEKYREKFDLLKEQIRIGEIYQACLTFPFHGPAVDNSRALFTQLMKKNPAPMASYMEQGSRIIMSLSPERFLLWDGTTIETKPIKGTRPRAEKKKEDQQMRQELLDDEKERAELNMITDLLRNDLAKVSKPGTVKVLSHRELQECPSVWHSYSHITAETKENIRAWDIVEAMFPGGSISGCPKKRAVEILSELESEARGMYTGCLGYISDHGRMDLNIAIRTLEQHEEGIQASFGGGIVYDSDPEQEYQECLAKAKPFI